MLVHLHSPQLGLYFIPTQTEANTVFVRDYFQLWINTPLVLSVFIWSSHLQFNIFESH